MVIVLTRVATLAAEVPEHQHSKSKKRQEKKVIRAEKC
jgi:hypothetical protein